MKKFGSRSPNVWTNYAHFLHATMNEPDRARELTARATQALEPRHHVAVMAKIAALEFRSPNGNPERGRTLFEGLLSTLPKRFDLWNQLADLEMGNVNVGGDGDAEADRTRAVRDVFERGAKVKGLKARQAERWFRRWAEWEEKMDPKGRDKVMARAQEWAAAARAKKTADAEVGEE